jgi:hypothetical protein
MTPWKQTHIVGAGGRIELLLLPDFRPGEAVDVSIERRPADVKPARRPMGFLAGKVEMSDDFDEP